jgi:hypothetical protein
VDRPSGSGASSFSGTTRDQLNRDYGARSEGATRTRDYGSYQRSGASSAGSYRGGGYSGGGRSGGGGRGGGGGGRRR